MTEETTESKLKKIARGTADQVAVHSDNVLWRVAEHVPGLSLLVARRERTLAQQQCVVMLEISRKLQGADPALKGEALYERAIMNRLSCDETFAREIVRLADLSFAQWPAERDVNFRDIVNYVIVHQIMTAHTKTMGTRIDMQDIVKAAIPEGL